MSVNWSWYSRLVEEVEKRRVFYDKKTPGLQEYKEKGREVGRCSGDSDKEKAGWHDLDCRIVQKNVDKDSGPAYRPPSTGGCLEIG